MHNELDDRDELLLAWSTVAGSSWQPDHSRGSSAFPSAINVFPNTTLGNQLKQVAKLMKFNLGSGVPALTRQIFFCSLGGFDTHQGQVNTQPHC